MSLRALFARVGFAASTFMTHPREDLPIDVENRGADGGGRTERVNAGKIEHTSRSSK